MPESRQIGRFLAGSIALEGGWYFGSCRAARDFADEPLSEWVAFGMLLAALFALVPSARCQDLSGHCFCIVNSLVLPSCASFTTTFMDLASAASVSLVTFTTFPFSLVVSSTISFPTRFNATPFVSGSPL